MRQLRDSHSHKKGKQAYPAQPQRSDSPPIQPSLRPAFLKHESLFFGVTPAQTLQDEAYEANCRAFYGVEAGTGQENRAEDEEWSMNVQNFFGVEGNGQREEAGKQHFDPRIRHSAGQRPISIPAGKRIPREPDWKPADSHSALAMFPPIAALNSAAIAAIPAGKKVPRDMPWKPEDEYRIDDMFPKRRKADRVKKLGDQPAGVYIEKDPVWHLGYGEKPTIYRKNLHFAAFSPYLRNSIKSSDRIAGKQIPRDPVFTLAPRDMEEPYPSRSQNRSALAKYGGETVEKHSGLVRASMDSRKLELRSLTPEMLPFAGAASQRDMLDRSDHNPILNPIGAQLPGPLYRRSSRR